VSCVYFGLNRVFILYRGKAANGNFTTEISLNPMRTQSIPMYTQEEQKVLFTYFDTVLIDFDSEVELKKIKDHIKRGNKKPGNK
jgi:hypothetical protein